MAIGLLLLLAGLAFCAWGISYFRRGNARYTAATTRWAQTQATILRSEIKVSQSVTNEGSFTNYTPVVAYSFHTGSAVQEGHRALLAAKDELPERKHADAWLAAHAPGAVVPVWFDPANPADSALMLNKPSLFSAVALTALGAVGIVFALFVLARAGRH